MLIIFSDFQGMVRKEFVLPGQTIDGKFYCGFTEVLQVAEGGHSAQTSRQVEEQQLVSLMTLHLLTHHLLFNNSWLPKTLH
jgi:hypothetical protein